MKQEKIHHFFLKISTFFLIKNKKNTIFINDEEGKNNFDPSLFIIFLENETHLHTIENKNLDETMKKFNTI